jgi:hypothetical protein
MDQLGHKRLSTTEIYLTAPSSTAPADVMAGILLEPEVLATVRKPPATTKAQKAAAPAGARKSGVTTKRVSKT